MIKLRTLPECINFCATIGNLPSSYMQSLSYEEQILWLCKFLEKEVLPAFNNNTAAVEELQNWFNNLDVQEEINNKLEAMAESGELEEIISVYLDSKAIFSYNTVSDMQEATNLIEGSTARTLGYYNLNDGGGATYKIREITNEDTVDGGFLIAMDNENLVAELIIENGFINALCLGSKIDDNTFNNSPILLNAISKANASKLISKIYYPAGTYNFTTSVDLSVNSLNLKSIEICGASTTEPDNNSCTIFKYTGDNYFLYINDGFNTKIHDLFISGTYTNKGIYAENTFWSDFYNLYIRRVKEGIRLDGYNAYDHIYNNSFITNSASDIGVIIGGVDTTYPINYPEYIWIERNHFELGAVATIGTKIYAGFFVYIRDNDFSNTTDKAISLNADSTVVHNIQDIFIENNSFVRTQTCVDIIGGISGSSITKIRIDGDYNNPTNLSNMKILNAVRGAGYLGFVNITGMCNDYGVNDKWITLSKCSNTVIDINNILPKNIEVIDGPKPKLVTTLEYDTNLIYENITGNVTATVTGHQIDYDFSEAIADTAVGMLIASGEVSGTSGSCNFSTVINRATRYNSTVLNGAGSNISSVTTNGRHIIVTCTDSYTPTANVGNVKFTFIR